MTHASDSVQASAYLPAATADGPTFVGDSEWHPLVDGVRYFSELDRMLADLGAGDSVQISGLDVDPALDLNGRGDGDAGYFPLGERLARAAAAGAQVRLLLAGKLAARWVLLPSLAGFRASLRHAERFRTWRPAGSAVAALATCVLVDYAGSLLGSNHQKVVVIGRGGELTAFVCGIDLVQDRFDAAPHDRMRLDGDRWGWHDAAVRMRGPAAGRVHEILAQRWREAATLPGKRYLRRGPARVAPLNPVDPAPSPETAPVQPAWDNPGTSVRVLRSVPSRKIDALRPTRRRTWQTLPVSGIQEIHATIVHALAAARRYVYLEDQYLQEFVGGSSEFELYPHLREAARRGVKVIMVGSGVRDPEDPGLYLRRINRNLNRHLQRKIVDHLDATEEVHFAVHRVEHLTVHAKVVLVDDVFACVGSANMFSRSMRGTDSEVSTAVTTTTTIVRDLRVRLWAEHLRAPLSPGLRASLEDLDLALGVWRAEWVPRGRPPSTWREPGRPDGYEPAESVLRAVWP